MRPARGLTRATGVEVTTPPYPSQPPSYPPPYPSGGYGFGVPPYPMGPPVQTGNGMAVAGLVLGILSVPLFVANWLDMIIAILAIVFAAIGLRRARQGRAGRKGMAVAGLVLGVIGLIAATVFLVVLVMLGLDLEHRCADQLGHHPSSSELQQCARDGI